MTISFFCIFERKPFVGCGGVEPNVFLLCSWLQGGSNDKPWENTPVDWSVNEDIVI